MRGGTIKVSTPLIRVSAKEGDNHVKSCKHRWTSHTSDAHSIPNSSLVLFSHSRPRLSMARQSHMERLDSLLRASGWHHRCSRSGGLWHHLFAFNQKP